MRKTIGYIPLDPGEQPDHKEHKIIDGQWLKLAEVWIPGVAAGSDLYERTHFKPKEGEEKRMGGRCANCNEIRSSHKGIDMMCRAKGEKSLPGMKYD